MTGKPKGHAAPTADLNRPHPRRRGMQWQAEKVTGKTPHEQVTALVTEAALAYHAKHGRRPTLVQVHSKPDDLNAVAVWPDHEVTVEASRLQPYPTYALVIAPAPAPAETPAAAQAD